VPHAYYDLRHHNRSLKPVSKGAVLFFQEDVPQLCPATGVTTVPLGSCSPCKRSSIFSCGLGFGVSLGVGVRFEKLDESFSQLRERTFLAMDVPILPQSAKYGS
jgi:hypothetical protein